MHDSRIPLTHPVIAGILAFLLPGAGHFYQCRLFKAGLYFVCIMGLFLTGMAMAGWQAVQPPPKGALQDKKGIAVLKYTAQACVGLPALYALVQRERYDGPSNIPVTDIERPFSAFFAGTAEYEAEQGLRTGAAVGTITLEPAEPQFGKRAISGRFEGTVEGRPVSLQLSRRVKLAKPVDSRKQRNVTAEVVDERRGPIGNLNGTIPRPFWNWFEAPMDEQAEQDLHRRLGKFHELAMVFTWIAGLLNVLAIWDAIEGPAYGYGDSEAPDKPTGARGATT